MKKGLLLLVSFSIYGVSNAQFYDWTGSKTPYHAQQTKQTNPPKGYQPFFINHVGRHGSRFMTKAGEDSLFYKILDAAQYDNGLSILGKKWKENAQWLIQTQKGHYADISLQGAAEQKAIAQRLRQQYPQAFHRGNIDVWYTHKVRTYQSAQGFLQSFTDYPNADVHFHTQPETAEQMLRFYDFSTEYDEYVKSSLVKEKTDSVQKQPSIAAVEHAVAYRFIKKEIWEKWAQQKTQISVNGKHYPLTTALFTETLFNVYGVGLSAKVEMKSHQKIALQWLSPFTPKEGKLLGAANDVEDYLVKGPGVKKEGIQSKIALPLLENFIQTSDSAVQGVLHREAILRFTHAEAISPFATLLEIKGTDDSIVSSIMDFNRVWNASRIIPMAANIQWVFFSNGKNILVKVLLNEKEAHLPIPTKQFPFYNWKDLKTYYSQKINRLK